MERFVIIFHLSSAAMSFVEIRRNDLASGADTAKMYHWLRLDAASRVVEKLDFQDMQSNPPREDRLFRQGSLHFDAVSGEFTSATTQEHVLLRVHSNAGAKRLLVNEIERYLDAVDTAQSNATTHRE